MELDFTWLTNLGQEQAKQAFTPATSENRPAVTHFDGILKGGQYDSLFKEKSPTESHSEPHRATEILQLKEEARRADHQRAVEVYKDHQKNIRFTEEIQAQILKGVKVGEDPCSLLLKAVEAISKMTGNQHFYKQVRADLIAVYGEALLYPLPIQWEIDETMERFQKILEAMGREHDPDAMKRIEASAKAHYAKVEKLQALLDQAQTPAN